MVCAAGACWLWWHQAPDHLSGRIDIVGHPTFTNYDFRRPFTAYRLLVWVLPLTSLGIFAALGRWRRAPATRLPLAGKNDRNNGGHLVARRPVTAVTAIASLVTCAALVALLASAASANPHARVGRRGVSAAVFYVALVLGASLAATLVMRRRGQAVAAAAVVAVTGLSVIPIVFGGIWYLSRYTLVDLPEEHRIDRWPWVPWWLPALSGALVLGMLVLGARRGRSGGTLAEAVRTWLLGPFIVFVIAAQLPGPQGRFEGFDDAQSLVGANLVDQGLFPWRDFTFIHGFWPDVLRAEVGGGIFEGSRWGVLAAELVVFAPLFWVLTYFLIVWFARREVMPVVTAVLLLLLGAPAYPAVRFLVLPGLLLLFGLLLERRTRSMGALFGTALVVSVVLVPELSALAVICPALILLSELLSRPRVGLLRRLKVTVAVAVTALSLLTVWFVFLWRHRAAGAFLQYYEIFGPGHAAAGAHPPLDITPRFWTLFLLPAVLCVLTFVRTYAVVGSRRGLAARDWVLLAAALNAALYGEKALGRFDQPHVNQVATNAVPLMVMWLCLLLAWLDRRASHLRRVVPPSGPPGSALTSRPVSAAVVLLLAIGGPQLSWFQAFHRLDRVPGRLHAAAHRVVEPRHLGYTTAGAFDSAAIAELRTALVRYAGPDAPVFDMTNALGYTYLLLDRRPASRFVHVSMAVPEMAQRLVIDELARTRPPVVLFDSDALGLPAWDGVRNNVRHFEVSRYVLRNWVPVAEVRGVLLLLRADLLAPNGRSGSPAPQERHELWFSRPACEWGYAPNFLSPRRTLGEPTALPLAPTRLQPVTIGGWLTDDLHGQRVRSVLLVSGGRVVAELKTLDDRPDVAAQVGDFALSSGFTMTTLVPAGEELGVYGLLTDGTVHPLLYSRQDRQATSVLRGAREVSIGAPIKGTVDYVVRSTAQVSQAVIPKGMRVSDFDLALIRTQGGATAITLTDGEVGGTSHEITLHALKTNAGAVGVGVGSCAQWHGYTGKRLFVVQRGGQVTSLDLAYLP